MGTLNVSAAATKFANAAGCLKKMVSNPLAGKLPQAKDTVSFSQQKPKKVGILSQFFNKLRRSSKPTETAPVTTLAVPAEAVQVTPKRSIPELETVIPTPKPRPLSDSPRKSSVREFKAPLKKQPESPSKLNLSSTELKEQPTQEDLNKV
jgi:hypothetical protein